MNTVNKIIVDVLTNEVESIPLTDVEIKALAKEAIQEEDNRLALEAEAEAKAKAKTVLLEKLGITAEEAALFLS